MLIVLRFRNPAVLVTCVSSVSYLFIIFFWGTLCFEGLNPFFIVYISCISHLALVQVIFYFYLYFKNKTHKDSKDVYNFTYSQYLE